MKEKPKGNPGSSSSPTSQLHVAAPPSSTVATSRPSIPTSSPKIIILATQSSLAGVKSSSAGEHVITASHTSSGDLPATAGFGTKSVVIKSTHSHTIPSSGTSHFVSSITSESLQGMMNRCTYLYFTDIYPGKLFKNQLKVVHH